jgi:hypothetical protein
MNYNVRVEKLVDVPHRFKAWKSQRRERENSAVFAIALVFAAMTRSLDGTLVKIDLARPAQLMVNSSRQFQTFPVAKRMVVDRKTSFGCTGAATTTPIDLADLTPGEYVRLQIDAQGRVTHAHAVACVEPAKVRSVSGSNVVLEDGTQLAIGSILRFVDERGKPSATATVRPGETVLLFRHPETQNIYRISAQPRSRRARARKRAK